tara:strand:- start:5847 stop:6035 length:189 start_codon:yes stop_codon:yes gene_type:complete
MTFECLIRGARVSIHQFDEGYKCLLYDTIKMEAKTINLLCEALRQEIRSLEIEGEYAKSKLL